jgi:hypothetical protein
MAIPADVSLVGFNDVFSTRYMTPPLTTIGFDAARIGELGAQLVLEQVGASNDKRKAVAMTVKPTLIVRGSTCPPALRMPSSQEDSSQEDSSQEDSSQEDSSQEDSTHKNSTHIKNSTGVAPEESVRRVRQRMNGST